MVMTGRELLDHLDDDIRRMRTRLHSAMESANAATADEARLQDAQLVQYEQLADIRLDFLKQTDDQRSLDAAHREAITLLADHDEFVERASQELRTSSEAISDLERERADIAAQHDAATKAYDDRANDIEAGLADKLFYKDLVATHQDALAVASRATQKQKLAEQDRREKGEPYDRDPLFTYLWNRKFRTSKYKAMPFFRWLDGWVADLCDYDKAYLNYQRLTELPVRLSEHVQRLEARVVETGAALDDADEQALRDGGAFELQQEAEQIEAQLVDVDARIETAEARHHEIADAHDRTVRSIEGPAAKAKALIEEALAAASMPTLRVMAAQTLALDDDHIVDNLVQMRAEETVLEREAKSEHQQAERMKADLKETEECRKRIKQSRLDSPYVTFRDAVVDDVLAALERGRMTASEAFGRLKRAARKSGRTGTGFGGARRRRTMGAPDILGDVMWEVARQAMRQGSSGSWGSYGGPRRSRPSIRMPRSSGRRGGGGFRTGGGF